MGTRADFYVGRGEDAEWLGSVAWDGYPGGLSAYKEGVQLDNEVKGMALFNPESEQDWRREVSELLKVREDGTPPEAGWPWPWDDSGTTDYAYAYDSGVFASCFASPWFDPRQEPDHDEEIKGDPPVFPNMAERKNVAPPGSKASGVMVISAPREDS